MKDGQGHDESRNPCALLPAQHGGPGEHDLGFSILATVTFGAV